MPYFRNAKNIRKCDCLMPQHLILRTDILWIPLKTQLNFRIIKFSKISTTVIKKFQFWIIFPCFIYKHELSDCHYSLDKTVLITLPKICTGIWRYQSGRCLLYQFSTSAIFRERTIWKSIQNKNGFLILIILIKKKTLEH